jgi:hypothetical protein
MYEEYFFIVFEDSIFLMNIFHESLILFQRGFFFYFLIALEISIADVQMQNFEQI